MAMPLSSFSDVSDHACGGHCCVIVLVPPQTRRVFCPRRFLAPFVASPFLAPLSRPSSPQGVLTQGGRVVRTCLAACEAGGAHRRLHGARLELSPWWDLRGRLHRNALGLRRSRLRDMHFEHPRLIGRSDLVRVHGGAQREAPAERAIRPFAVMRIAVLPVLAFVLDGPFALQRQDVVLNADVDIILLQAGEIRHQDEFLVVLPQVYPGIPQGLMGARRRHGPRERIEQPFHLTPQRLHPREGAPGVLGRPPRHHGIPTC
jgi:hypothetical protein